MQNTLMTCMAAGAVSVLTAFASPSAQAMTLPAPTGLSAAIEQSSPVQDVACRPVWRCGPWGCGWRRACWWGPGAPYAYSYGYRPYWGWGWRHRRW